MNYIKNKVKFGGETFTFRIANVVERNNPYPITSGAVFTQIENLLPLSGYRPADTVTTNVSEERLRTNSLVTVSSLIGFLQAKGLI